jgi:PKD repeat protein
MVVKYPGQYTVMGSWYPNPLNATNARYTILHGDETSVGYADQRQTLLLNPIGTYFFDAGSHKIILDDYADGQVVADAILLNPLENPPEILLTEFTADQTSGPVGMSVEFDSRNTYYNMANPIGGIVAYDWDFGDGNDSNSPDPTHIYASPGVYTVSLTVTDLSGDTATEVKDNFIAVGQAAPLEAEFSTLSRLGSDRAVVNFIDQSTGDITEWEWDFGDGQTSTEQNPVHVYEERGIYDVTLTVSGPGGTDTETEEGFVYNVIGLIYADNTSIGKPHFYSRSGVITFGKIICYTGDVKINENELRYSRMFHSACNSFQYFTGTFHRGVMFAKTKDVSVEHDTCVQYLEAYLGGSTDYDILDYVNSIENIHEFYNFNEKPPSMR